MPLDLLDGTVSDVRGSEARQRLERVKPKPALAVRNPFGRIGNQQAQAMRRVNSKRIDLNDSNRLVRTRMPGGVGGDRSDYLAAPIPIRTK